MNLVEIEGLLFGSSSVMVVSALLTFLGLSFFAAPYGKYSATKGFGPLVPAQIAWCFMEIPNLWVSLIVYIYRGHVSDPAIYGDVNKLALFCFLLHYVNRSIIYPYRMRTNSCTPMPASVMFAALVFCSWNGLNQATSLILVDHNQSSISDLKSIVGLIVFAAGFYINVTSDSILINAKKNGEKVASGVSKYVIPTGGMFEFISCANYCKSPLTSFMSLPNTHFTCTSNFIHNGDIYRSWRDSGVVGLRAAMRHLHWPLLRSLLHRLPLFQGLPRKSCHHNFMCAATKYSSMCSVCATGVQYHAWYKEKFEDYPKNRKAVFPFVL